MSPLLCSCSKKDDSQVLSLHTISFTKLSHVSATLNKSTAYKGEDITITINNIDTGFYVTAIKANGHQVDNNHFIMPDENVEISIELGTIEIPSNLHSITLINHDMGYVESNKLFAEKNEKINLSYVALDRFVFDYYLVNNEKLYEQTFIMPDEDVVVQLVLKDSIINENNFLTCYSGGLIGRSFWNFSYSKETFDIYVQVMDRYVSGVEYQSDIGFRDNIEFILSINNDCDTLLPFYTRKYLISCDNGFYEQGVNYDGTFADSTIPDSKYFSSESCLKSRENGDGYDGYDISVSVSYKLLGITRSEAVGNLSICTAMRNSMYRWDSQWTCDNKFGCSWLLGGTHPLVSETGELIYKSIKEETA